MAPRTFAYHCTLVSIVVCPRATPFPSNRHPLLKVVGNSFSKSFLCQGLSRLGLSSRFPVWSFALLGPKSLFWTLFQVASQHCPLIWRHAECAFCTGDDPLSIRRPSAHRIASQQLVEPIHSWVSVWEPVTVAKVIGWALVVRFSAFFFRFPQLWALKDAQLGPFVGKLCRSFLFVVVHVSFLLLKNKIPFPVFEGLLFRKAFCLKVGFPPRST